MMTAALDVCDRHGVLEIGTGSGYQTAILARLARRVTTIERFRTLSKAAERRFQALGIRNISARRRRRHARLEAAGAVRPHPRHRRVPRAAGEADHAAQRQRHPDRADRTGRGAAAAHALPAHRPRTSTRAISGRRDFCRLLRVRRATL